jgi:hypothetical protein
MSYKQHLLNCITHEIMVCKKLFEKIPAGKYEYSPADGMRTTAEVLRYLTWCGSSSIEYYANNQPENSNAIYTDNLNYAKTMTTEMFPQRMDEQLAKIQDYFAQITEEELLNKEVELPWGTRKPLGEAIMETTLKWLVGYKMQLFLYAKMSGGAELDTGDCWIDI